MDDHGDAMDWSEDCEKYFLEILSERVKKEKNGAPILKGVDWIEMNEKIFFEICIKIWTWKVKGKISTIEVHIYQI